MNNLINHYISSLLSYIDQLRLIYQVDQSNIITVLTFIQLDDFSFLFSIEISPAFPLFSHFPLTDFKTRITSLFLFPHYELINLDISIENNKVVITIQFKLTSELVPDIIKLEIIKYISYDQILALANSNYDYKNYFNSFGWLQTFKLKYPYLYHTANLFRETKETNLYYREVIQLIELVNNNLRLKDYIQYLEIIIYLIEEYAINPADQNNQVIILAAENGQLEVVKYLLSLPAEYGINPADQDNLAIRWAAQNGHLEVVKYLMSLSKEYGINPADQNNSAIILAAKNGKLEVVKYLISLPSKYGINPADKNNEAIILAAGNGHLEVVKYLMSLIDEYGINPAAQNNEAIIETVANGHLEVVKYLMSLPPQYGINPAAQNNQAIKWAAENRHLEVVEYLLSLPPRYGIKLPNAFIKK